MSATFDTAEAITFLDQVFGDVSSGLIGITAIDHAGRTTSKPFQFARHAVERAAYWDAQHPLGIYFRTTMLPPQGVRKVAAPSGIPTL